MPSKESRNDNNAFWNLTNSLLVVVFLTVAGLLSYLAISTRANAAEISDVRSKANVNAAVLGLVRDGIPGIRGQLNEINMRLYRLEARFNTLPEKE